MNAGPISPPAPSPPGSPGSGGPSGGGPYRGDRPPRELTASAAAHARRASVEASGTPETEAEKMEVVMALPLESKSKLPVSWPGLVAPLMKCKGQ